MFNKDFYPTPPEVIEYMLQTVSIRNKIVLEPSAGSGNIVKYLINEGAKKIITCEIEPTLQPALAKISTFLKPNFLDVRADEISQIDFIIMNPPFSEASRHILHAFEIMPEGCQLIALCNIETINNTYSQSRLTIKSIIERYGFSEDLGQVFKTAERKTMVGVGLINVLKPKTGKSQLDDEFASYFDLNDDSNIQANEGIIRYDEIQDVVSRYVGAVRLYDSVHDNGVKMNELIKKFSPYLKSGVVFTATVDSKDKSRAEFKLDLQKAAWRYVFSLFKMEKYLTSQTKADINKFIEDQTQIPFTVKNIYKMIELLIGTTGSRMDKAIIEVFDKFTQYDKENQYGLPGFKTNSNFLLNRKIIVPNIFDYDKRWPREYMDLRYSNGGRLDDFTKVLCYLTGTDYNDIGEIYQCLRYEFQNKNDAPYTPPKSDYIIEFNEHRKRHDALVNNRFSAETIRKFYGDLYKWGFFEFRGFKKGTIHLTFLDEKVWGKFNREVARIKGYPLPSEFRESYQPKNYTQADREKAAAERKQGKSPASSQSKYAAPKANPTTTQPKQTISRETVDITYNPKKGGLEIKFKTPITDATKEYLKANGFMFSATNQFWWTGYTAKLLSEVKAYFSNTQLGLSGYRKAKQTAKQKLLTLKHRIK